MKDALLQLLPSFDVISFDIFDTLLLRPFLKPTDLFWKMERDECAKGFANARIAGEHNAHRKAMLAGRVEATFDEIYDEIPEWKSMREKELDSEKKQLVANPEMLCVWKAAKAAGKIVVVTSDMYLPADFLKSVLIEKGFDGWDGFYLSNERQAQKCSGSLYAKLLEDHRVAPGRILHIGDNPISDVNMANKNGIVAYGYQKIIDKFLEECPFAKAFLGCSPPLEKRLLGGAVALGWHLYKCGHPDWNYWNKIGFLFAGTLGYAYMRFVGDSAIRKGFNHLMFVARDGYILEKIFNVLYPSIKTDYFYSARTSILVATLDFTCMETDLKDRRESVLNYLVSRMGIRLPDSERERIVSTWQLPPEVELALKDASGKERLGCEKYMSQFEITDRTALVDGTSSNFSVQRFLAHWLGAGKTLHGYYLNVMRTPKDADSFYSVGYLSFQNFSEILFGAPVPPLASLASGSPEFKTDTSFFEDFKSSISNDISKGAVECSAILNGFSVGIGNLLWYDWYDAFARNTRCEDRELFTLVRNATGVSHSKYGEVLGVGANEKRIRLFGRTILVVRTERFGFKFLRVLYLLGRWPVLKVRRWPWG